MRQRLQEMKTNVEGDQEVAMPEQIWKLLRMTLIIMHMNVRMEGIEVDPVPGPVQVIFPSPIFLFIPFIPTPYLKELLNLIFGVQS